MSSVPTFRFIEGLKDIRFWILLFFLVRLVGITNPPLETGHNWRQTVVNMTARNFHESEIDLMHPRVDIAGELSGITGMEFPFYNACISVMMDLFGEAHWYGRLLNLIIASIGIWFFYKLIRDYVDERTAFFAAMILLASLWFSMSRKIIPDIFSCSLMIIGIERSLGYITGRLAKPWLLLGAAFCAMAVLIKLSVGCWMILLPLSYFLSHTDRSRWWTFQIVQGIFLLSVVYWYGYWVPHLVETYGYWHFFMGKGMAEGAVELVQHIPDLIKRFAQTPFGYIGFVLFLLGIYSSIKEKNSRLIGYCSAVFLLFLIFIMKSGENFIIHNYYSIPMIPLMACIAAQGLLYFTDQRWSYAILALIMIEAVLNQVHDFKIPPDKLLLIELESRLDPLIGKEDLIWINGDGSPTSMYFAHRKGWSEGVSELNDSEHVKQLRARGCDAFVLIDTDYEPPIHSGLVLVLDNDWLRIFK